MINVGEIMTKQVIRVNENDSLLSAAKTMASHGIGCVVVDTEKEGYGVLTERDFLNFVVQNRRDVLDVKVSELMTYPATTVEPGLSIYEASKLMQVRGFRRLPVTENGQLMGIVTQTDLNEALREDTIRSLRAKLDELEMINKLTMTREMEIEELKQRLAKLESGETETAESGE